MNIEPLLYYSVNTWLSNRINNRFYGGSHYVWCAPIFDPMVLDAYHIWRSIPPSSSPKSIYYRYKEDVSRLDQHSALINQNKAGLIKGATFKHEEGVITESELQIIFRMIEKSSLTDFRPMLYIIPNFVANDKLEKVDVNEIANPLSIEFRIASLMNGEFDIIEPSI